MFSGLNGTRNGLPLPKPVEEPYDEGAPKLSTNLSEAINLFIAGELYRVALRQMFVDYFMQLKRTEWQRYILQFPTGNKASIFRLFRIGRKASSSQH